MENQLRLCKVCYSYFCFKAHDDILDERRKGYDLAMADTLVQEQRSEKPRKSRKPVVSKLQHVMKEEGIGSTSSEASVPINPPRTHNYDYPFPKREELPKKETNELFSSKYWISAYDNEYFCPGKGRPHLPPYEPGYSRNVPPYDTTFRGYSPETQYNCDFPFDMHIPGAFHPVRRLPDYPFQYGKYPFKDTVIHSKPCKDRFYDGLDNCDLPPEKLAEILCNYHGLRSAQYQVHRMADMGLHPDPDHERRCLDKLFHLRADQEKLGLTESLLPRGVGGFIEL